MDVVQLSANRLPVAEVVGEIQMNAELHRYRVQTLGSSIFLNQYNAQVLRAPVKLLQIKDSQRNDCENTGGIGITEQLIQLQI